MLLPELRTWPSDPRKISYCSYCILFVKPSLMRIWLRPSLEMKRFKQRHCHERCTVHAATEGQRARDTRR